MLMKRLPVLLSLLALVVLSASLVYWVLQLYQPAQRPLASAPPAAMADPAVDAAATLFGGQVATAVATNYQLTGVVAAGRESVAIIVADGAPPKALQLGKEVSAGVTVREVHPRYVMLSDGGVLKRIELALENKAAGGVPASPLPGQPQQAQQFQPQPPQPQPQQQLQMAPVTQPQPVQQAQPPAAVQPPPPPAPVQMAPPTRTVNPGNTPAQIP
jgi:general secretion pathway protein C